jgi:hypothetical protein
MPQPGQKTYEFPIPAAPAAKVPADTFVHLILHPTSGLIAIIANVGRGLRAHDGRSGGRSSGSGRKGWHREDLADTLSYLLDMQRQKEKSQ